METKIKTTEVTFDAVKTLYVISANDDLMEMYQKKYGTDIKLAITMAKGGLLKNDGAKYLKGIFENIILSKEELLSQYIKLEQANSQKKVEDSTKKDTPRRYGKVQIQKDIAEQGGKPTDMQRTMLKVNDLKRLIEKFSRRAIAEQYEGEKKLTDKDWRDIEGAIDLLESKAKKVLSKAKDKKTK